MSSAIPVRLYFDFVSPYAWLALSQAREFASTHGVRWEIRPVVYAALLDAAGLVGPAESESKRRYVFHDVRRCAHALGRKLTGPPAHPFRSLEALRTICLFQDQPQAVELAARIADACWSDGRDLTDLAVLQEQVRASGLQDAELARRVASPDVKLQLRRQTERAIATGVFGVPTFRWHDHLFWGHDRLGHLADAIAGRDPDDEDLAASMLARPRGADRRRLRAP